MAAQGSTLWDDDEFGSLGEMVWMDEDDPPPQEFIDHPTHMRRLNGEVYTAVQLTDHEETARSIGQGGVGVWT